MDELFTFLDLKRRSSDRLQELDLLEAKDKFDLNIAQTLDLVDKYLFRLKHRKNNTPRLLQTFFASYIDIFNPKSVFEYGAYGSSFAARNINDTTDFKLTYASWGDQLNDCLLYTSPSPRD